MTPDPAVMSPQKRKYAILIEITQHVDRIRGFTTMRYINPRFTYLLTVAVTIKPFVSEVSASAKYLEKFPCAWL